MGACAKIRVPAILDIRNATCKENLCADNSDMSASALTSDDTPNRRLKALYEAKKRELHLSQDRIAAECGWASQSTVSQYLNGLIPINFEAAVKFATLLRCSVGEFHTEFGAILDAYQAVALNLPRDALAFAQTFAQLDSRRQDAARNFVEYQLFTQKAGELSPSSGPTPPDRPFSVVKRVRDN